MTRRSVSVCAVSAANMQACLALMRAIEAERLPADTRPQAGAAAVQRAGGPLHTDPNASERYEAELRRSLARFDFTQSGSCRMLLASVGGTPAGYALVVRIPKPDARVGFLFVEELYVLGPYRRVGVAGALLRHCESVAREWGLHGIRLLVRPENDAARRLYRQAGFSESTSMFCEKLL